MDNNLLSNRSVIVYQRNNLANCNKVCNMMALFFYENYP